MRTKKRKSKGLKAAKASMDADKRKAKLMGRPAFAFVTSDNTTKEAQRTEFESPPGFDRESAEFKALLANGESKELHTQLHTAWETYNKESRSKAAYERYELLRVETKLQWWPNGSGTDSHWVFSLDPDVMCESKWFKALPSRIRISSNQYDAVYMVNFDDPSGNDFKVIFHPKDDARCVVQVVTRVLGPVGDDSVWLEYTTPIMGVSRDSWQYLTKVNGLPSNGADSVQLLTKTPATATYEHKTIDDAVREECARASGSNSSSSDKEKPLCISEVRTYIRRYTLDHLWLAHGRSLSS